MSIEDRRKPIHEGLSAALPAAADNLASHCPYLHKANHFLSIKRVILYKYTQDTGFSESGKQFCVK